MKEKGIFIKIKLLIGVLLLVFSIVKLCDYAKFGHSNVVLSEVCCYNDTIIYNTIGDYLDYVELYNPTDSSMDISGFCLSDDKDNLSRYTLPENTILESGEYLLLWAGVWTTDITRENDSYYMGFSLRGGETLYLSDKEGEILDKIKIPDEIERDSAYSRVSLSNSRWGMTAASPGTVNDTGLLQIPTLQTEVKFSAQSGFYEEPFYLEMLADDSCDIYYTLDGSIPTVESLKYEGAILIEDATNNENKYAGIAEITLDEDMYIPSDKVTKATVIRAIAVNNWGEVSEESYATYFVDFDKKSGFENVVTISLITDPDNFFGYENGIYVTGKIWDMYKEEIMGKTEYWQATAITNYTQKAWKRETALQYFDESGKLQYEQQVGVGTHGRSSLAYNQKSLNLIALPESDGQEFVLTDIFGREERTLMLRNGGGDCFSAKLRDVLTQEMVKGRWVTVSDYKPCQVFLDGEYWGLYMLQERAGESMVSGQYDIPETNLVVIKGDEVVAGVEDDFKMWEDVLTFAKEKDLSVESNYKEIEQMIDIQSCIDHYCFQIYVANCDSLVNNVAMWRVKEKGNGEYEDGKWRWILYDIDSSAGGMAGLNTAEVDSFISGNYWGSPLKDELLHALLQNEEFKRRFVITFMDMANYNFRAEKVIARIDELAEELADATVASQRRFLSDTYSKDDYMVDINDMKRFFESRYLYITEYMKSDLELTGQLTKIEVENGIGGEVRVNTVTLNEGELFSCKYYSDYEVELYAEPNADYTFSGWLVNGKKYADEYITLPLSEDYVVMPIWEMGQ